MSAHVITVAQQKGGSGKTTLAIHLATAFAQRGLSTMLFDTDPQGTASHWHAQRKKNDVGLIATSGWRLTRDLAMAREANDIIIIDTPPHAEMDIKVSTRAADMVLVPLQPSPADVWAVRETMNTIASESSDAMVVMNRVVPRANITKDVADKLKSMDVPVAEHYIGNRVLFAAAMETGMTVLDGFKNPSMAEVNALVDEIAEKMGIASAAKKSSKKSATTKTTKAKSKSGSSSTKTQESTEGQTTAKKSASSKKTTKTTKTAAKKSSSKTKTETAATTTKKPTRKTKPAAKTATKRKTLRIVTKKKSA
ncbi:MAG: ParA family protein [Alphaproteobacteria bacterium]|nr:ParA family protein [Alphaproteobacteria bacterium]MDD9919670.1 ParA family protein [Alphaproteobacteria bacterium]